MKPLTVYNQNERQSFRTSPSLPKLTTNRLLLFIELTSGHLLRGSPEEPAGKHIALANLLSALKCASRFGGVSRLWIGRDAIGFYD